MPSKLAIVVAATCLLMFVAGGAEPRTITKVRTIRTTVPISLTEPVTIPQCKDCTTWGDAVLYIPELRAAAESCNARLGAIREWSKANRQSE